jgi:hypothetical protein
MTKAARPVVSLLLFVGLASFGAAAQFPGSPQRPATGISDPGLGSVMQEWRFNGIADSDWEAVSELILHGIACDGPKPHAGPFSLELTWTWPTVFSLLERFSGLGFTGLDGFAASDPGVTSLAGFAGARRPHAPGGRTPIPAAFR